MGTNIADIRAFTRRFGLDDNFTEGDAETLHQLVALMQHNFGMTRIKLGALLLAVKHHELWAGKAQSFGEYLESLNIKAAAAKQYMEAAEKLMFHLKLDDNQLAAAARASMTTLVAACKIMTPYNAADIISVLETLSDRDAKHVIGNYAVHVKPLHEGKQTDPKVKKLEREYLSLPYDLRCEFMFKISGQMKSQKN